MAKFCQYCGSPVDQATQKCTFCGWVSPDAPVVTPQQPQSDPNNGGQMYRSQQAYSEPQVNNNQSGYYDQQSYNMYNGDSQYGGQQYGGQQQYNGQVQYNNQPNYQTQTMYQEAGTAENSYVDPAYLDQEKIIYPGDPRFTGNVNPNDQFRTRQVPMVYQNGVTGNMPQVSRVAAGILAIFFGSLGVHKFYMHHSSAIAYLLCTILSCGVLSFIPAIISIIEGATYLTMSDDEFEQKYHVIVTR